MSPETPDAPPNEPHSCPENTPDEVDPATKLQERQKPDEHNGEYIIPDRWPVGDEPATLLPPDLDQLHTTFSR